MRGKVIEEGRLSRTEEILSSYQRGSIVCGFSELDTGRNKRSPARQGLRHQDAESREVDHQILEDWLREAREGVEEQKPRQEAVDAIDHQQPCRRQTLLLV